MRQKLKQEQNLAEKQQKKEPQLAIWHSMMERCPYPPEQLSALYDEATKLAEEKGKKLRAAWKEERKAIGSWQAASYGMYCLPSDCIVGLTFSLSVILGAKGTLRIAPIHFLKTLFPFAVYYKNIAVWKSLPYGSILFFKEDISHESVLRIFAFRKM